jgi:peptidoglycan DL-endopeptidase CwlO
VGAACAALLATSLAVASASPPSVQTLRQRVDHLEGVLAARERRSEALAQNFDALQGRLTILDASLRRMTNRIRANARQLAATAQELQADAVMAYVYGSTSADSVALFTQDANQNGARSVYQQAVIGNVTQVEAAYRNQSSLLVADHRNLGAQRAAVAVVTGHAAALLTENNDIAARTNRLVASMGKQLHHLVLEAAIAAARAAARARAAAAAAGDVGVAGQLGGEQGTIAALRNLGHIDGSATGNAAGMHAFAAAETQLGVPYLWGGETPNVGFDCSGLTQWSWAQAGVSIPRTAAEQWSALPHVSVHSLQPGDLLFYFNLDGDNQVDHVVMYGGSGPFGTQTTIAAAYTGTDIALDPAFTLGLIGAARP